MRPKKNPVHSSFLTAVPRYGPITNMTYPYPQSSSSPHPEVVDDDTDDDEKDNFFAHQEEWEKEDEQRIIQQEKEFRLLLKQIMDIQQEQEDEMYEVLLPSLMTRNIQILLNMRGYEGTTLMKHILQQAQDEEEKGPKEISSTTQDDCDRSTMTYYQRVSKAMEYILSFMEEFVNQSQSLDEQNKLLLGKIIRAITHAKQQPSKYTSSHPASSSSSQADDEEEDYDIATSSSSTTSTFQQDNAIDVILQQERDSFTPGFLRHLEGECQRIESAPFINSQSIAMLQLLRMIQLRIVEELGQEDLDDTALILGQLLGYESKYERLAILQTNLNIRGIDFAHTLKQTIQQALQEFDRMKYLPNYKVDDELIRIVSEMDECVHMFIHNNKNKATISSSSSSTLDMSREENFQ